MKHLALLFVLAFLLYSCETSEPAQDVPIVEVVDDTAIDVENEEETEEEDRWANFVYTTITIKPYYYPNSEIEYYYNEYDRLASKIVEGDRLVFFYSEAAHDRIDTITGQRLADSAYRKHLLFAIDSDKTEFKLENTDFSAASSKYGLFAFFPDSGYHEITNGFIEGIKISETEWEITTNITWTIPANEFHGEDLDYEFQLSSNFIPEPEE
ncbi:hypothetical protein [Gillisia sp. CAL575]|uniref:hypothetical protein n=1 Tax=Gillisia sp. CAL575 TaxID=985255 RepID=UPI00039B1624|nr:hypothetical protein [Gillisia sp. CAL575]